MLTHVSLFSGIGGLDIAAHREGFETIQFVERDGYCQKVLRKNFPGIDIHDDITTFDATRLRGRTSVVSGGPPCPEFSQANKFAKGIESERGELVYPRILQSI